MKFNKFFIFVIVTFIMLIIFFFPKKYEDISNDINRISKVCRCFPFSNLVDEKNPTSLTAQSYCFGIPFDCECYKYDKSPYLEQGKKIYTKCN